MLGDSDLGGGRHLQAASYWQMDSMYAPTLFGLFAVTAMLFCDRLEGRSHWFVLAFAGRVHSARRPNQFTYREAPQ